MTASSSLAAAAAPALLPAPVSVSCVLHCWMLTCASTAQAACLTTSTGQPAAASGDPWCCRCGATQRTTHTCRHSPTHTFVRGSSASLTWLQCLWSFVRLPAVQNLHLFLSLV